MALEYVELSAGSGGSKILLESIDSDKFMPVTKLYVGAAEEEGDPLDFGQAAMAASVPVVISSDQSAVAVSAASLPLPTGAATAAKQLADGHAVTVDNASIAVTAASLPLPTGAATASAQLPDGHAVTVDNASIAITAAALPLPTGAATSSAQLPDGHAVTVDNASIAITAAALPLPAAAATAAKQLADDHNVTISNASLAITHTALTELAAAIVSNELNVNIASDGVGIGGGTQYAEGADDSSPTGTALMLVTQSSIGFQAAEASLLGNLRCSIEEVGAATSTGTEDDVAPASVTIVGGRWDSTPRTITTAGYLAAIALNQDATVKLPGQYDEADAMPSGGYTGLMMLANANDDTAETLTLSAAGSLLVNVAETAAVLPTGIDSSNLYDGVTAMTPKYAKLSSASSGNQALIAAVAGKTTRVCSLQILCVASTNTVYINDGTDDLYGDATRGIPLDVTGAAGAGGLTLPYNPHGWFETGADNRPININLGDTNGIIAVGQYVEV